MGKDGKGWVPIWPAEVRAVLLSMSFYFILLYLIFIFFFYLFFFLTARALFMCQLGGR